MGWVEALWGSLVAVDTAPLIYFIEENPLYAPYIEPFFDALDAGRFRAVTSILTLTEVLIHPVRASNLKLVQEYRRILLHSGNIETLPVSAVIAEKAALLRAKHNLRMPDSIQIATALTAGATSFLTNDLQLAGEWMPGVIVLDRIIRTS